ncbi:MAG: LysR family transcriptional regulator [Pseudomonadota bacterium]|nr:LysR family transcriptional regulator [Pseudomonadota bacterium]
MKNQLQPTDLDFFATLVRAGSLSAAGRELGVSTAAVSRHLAQMEQRVGLALLNRTTRRMSPTPEGELVAERARRVRAELDELQQALGGARAEPQGLLRVNATLGFGRSHIAPLVSRFCRQHPKVDVQLHLSVDPPPMSDDAFDLCFRFGPPPESRAIARFIAPNRRIVVATPAYLKKCGTPLRPADLARHACIGIRQGDDAFGTWRFSPASPGRGRGAGSTSVKVRGPLTTNDGGVAVGWALEGHGLLLRAEWDVARYLQSGRLRQVLTDWHSPDADIYAVYPERHRASVRVKALADFAAQAMQAQASR